MARYLQPDKPPFGYHPTGELLSLTMGDFLKCGHCRRFQRYEGRLYALGELAGAVLLCCSNCRQSGVTCHPWPSDRRKTG